MDQPIAKQQSTEKMPDLMGWLREEFLKANPERINQYEEGIVWGWVEEFVVWSRAFLRNNQPTGLDYLSQGLGLRLQDGTVVAWVNADESAAVVGGVAGEVPITQPTERSFRQGITPSVSFPVTGRKPADGVR